MKMNALSYLIKYLQCLLLKPLNTKRYWKMLEN